MIYYIAIDPGKSSGLTWYDEKAKLLGMDTVFYENLSTILNKFTTVRVAVIEDYKVYPQKAKQHIYSDLTTSRAIGRIEAWADYNKIKLVKQGAHIKNTGYKYLGKKPLAKSNPLNHPMDAHAHFTYFAVCNGFIDPTDLLKGV